MKISREGVLLIKSFEGFRSRAAANPGGGWVIGYGHQASAREGASVSEAEAELLLQYDLIPVQAALTQGLTRSLNQHQYDALASFAFSVGVDAFLTSDVLSRVNSGEDADAVEALTVWPETPRRDAGLRRRAAERALFLADPAQPVALADLLAAPLPPIQTPPQPTPVQSVEETVFPTEAAAIETVSIEDDALETSDAEAVPAEISSDAADPSDVATEDALPVEDVAVEITTPEFEIIPADASDASSVEDQTVTSSDALLEAVASVVEPDLPETTAPAEPAPEAASESILEPAPVTPVFSPRYMAYAGASFGPLPIANDDAFVPSVVDLGTTTATAEAPEAVEPLVLTPQSIEADAITASETGLTVDVEDETSSVLVAAFTSPTTEETFETAAVAETPAPIDVVDSTPADPSPPMPAAWEAVTEWSAPAFQPSLVLPENPGADPFAGATLTSPASSATLVWPALNETLSEPSEDAPTATPRLVWPREDAAPAASSGLFEDNGDLNPAGATAAWGEGFDARPNVFAWRKVWAYLVMGGFGLVSLAVSMAALRKASLANTDIGGILAIAAVLALIGAACVGVSAYNIYQRITDDR